MKQMNLKEKFKKAYSDTGIYSNLRIKLYVSSTFIIIVLKKQVTISNLLTLKSCTDCTSNEI